MADAKKAGWKTSEFWATAITGIVTIVNSSGWLPFHIPEDQVAIVAGLVASYVLSRAGLKAYVVSKESE